MSSVGPDEPSLTPQKASEPLLFCKTSSVLSSAQKSPLATGCGPPAGVSHCHVAVRRADVLIVVILR